MAVKRAKVLVGVVVVLTLALAVLSLSVQVVSGWHGEVASSVFDLHQARLDFGIEKARADLGDPAEHSLDELQRDIDVAAARYREAAQQYNRRMESSLGGAIHALSGVAENVAYGILSALRVDVNPYRYPDHIEPNLDDPGHFLDPDH